MLEEKALSDTAKALGLGSLLPAVYNDLLSPAAKELGEGLATVAKAVKIGLAPVKGAVWGYEQIEKWLSFKVTSLLAERRAENIQSPPLSVAGPLVMQMVFASEEPDLREMYAKLLATSMDCATAADAHPSFVALIQQLTPDEAKILRHIAVLKTNQDLKKHSPFEKTYKDYRALEAAMLKVCIDAGVSFPRQSQVYIENLIRLRILTYNRASEAEFRHGEQDLDTGHSYDDYISSTDIEWIELSPYGNALLEACVVDKIA